MSTYYGHCQVCGRKQAVRGGLLVAHGYHLKWHFQAGACQGQGHRPIETDRSIVDAMAATHRADAEAALALSARYKARQDHPEMCQYGDRTRWVGRRLVTDPVMVPWAEAPPSAQRQHLEAEASRLLHEARHKADWADDMQALAGRVHGQPLEERSKTVKVRSTAAPGEVRLLPSGLAVVATSVEERRVYWVEAGGDARGYTRKGWLGRSAWGALAHPAD